MEAISLERFPHLPVYESCIKNYRRPILPPLVLPSQKEEIETLRNQAVHVETKVKENKEQKTNLMEVVQDLTKAVINAQTALKDCNLMEVPNCNEHSQSQNNLFQIVSLPNESNFNSSVSNKNTFRSGIYYEEVIDNDVEEISVPLLDCNTSKNSSDHSNSNSCYSDEQKTYSPRVQLVVNDAWVKGLSEQVSEINDEESSSTSTLVCKDNKDTCSDIDSDCVATSVNQSTDLDKYLDSSFDDYDDGHHSDVSVVNNSLGNNRVSNNISESAEIVISGTCSLMPIPQSSIEVTEDDQNISKNSTSKLSVKTSDASISHVFNESNSSDDMYLGTSGVSFSSFMETETNRSLETNSTKTWLQKVLEYAQDVDKTDAKKVKKHNVQNVEEENTISAGIQESFGTEENFSVKKDKDKIFNAQNAQGKKITKLNVQSGRENLNQTFDIQRNEEFMKITDQNVIKKGTSKLDNHTVNQSNSTFNGEENVIDSDISKLSDENIMEKAIDDPAEQGIENDDRENGDDDYDDEEDTVKEIGKLGSGSPSEVKTGTTRHVRSNSYTLDSPSPVLARSHAGCHCEVSGNCVTMPHCTSIHSENNPGIVEKNESGPQSSVSPHLNTTHDILPSMSESEECDSSVFLKSNGDISFQSNCCDSINTDVSGAILENSIAQKAEENISLPKSTHNENSEADSKISTQNENVTEVSPRQLYERFVAMREKTFDDLHTEHVKQWKKLSEDFEKQEKLFLERLHALEISDSRGSVSSGKFSSDVTPIVSPVCGAQASVRTYTPVAMSPNSSQSSSVNVAPVSQNSLIDPDPEKSPLFLPQRSSLSQPCLLNAISVARSFMGKNSTRFLAHVDDYEQRMKNINSVEMQKKFEKVSAAVKGYLTRRLLKTERVQAILKILRDCAIEAAEIVKQVERGENFSDHDMIRHKKIFCQLVESDEEIHNIFFNISIKDRMKIIADSRESKKKEKKDAVKFSSSLSDMKTIKDSPSVPSISVRKLSSATLKALERKQMKSYPENRSYSSTDMHLHKKASVKQTYGRKRILSPRSCSISPTSSKKNHTKVGLCYKKNSGTNKHQTVRPFR